MRYCVRMPGDRLILGVNIAGGVAYMALVKEPDIELLDSPTKIAPSDSHVDAVRLKDFGDRFVQQARELGVNVVAIANTRKYKEWAYAHAFERISLEVTLMLMLKQAGIECRSVSQESAAKLIEISKPKDAHKDLANGRNGTSSASRAGGAS